MVTGGPLKTGYRAGESRQEASVGPRADTKHKMSSKRPPRRFLIGVCPLLRPTAAKSGRRRGQTPIGNLLDYPKPIRNRAGLANAYPAASMTLLSGAQQCLPCDRTSGPPRDQTGTGPKPLMFLGKRPSGASFGLLRGWGECPDR